MDNLQCYKFVVFLSDHTHEEQGRVLPIHDLEEKTIDRQLDQRCPYILKYLGSWNEMIVISIRRVSGSAHLCIPGNCTGHGVVDAR
jgi:hypothetical protein